MIIEFTNIAAYILVFARLAGLILLSPIFANSSIPQMFRMGFILLLTLLITPLVAIPIEDLNFILLVGYILKEVLIGMFLGFILNIFIMLLSSVSDVIDQQIGIAMAKTMDPLTNVQSASVSLLMGYMFLLFFLSTNCHLRLIELYVQTYNVLGLNDPINLSNICLYVSEVFISTFEFAIRLALPFMAVEFLIEMSLGILMKMIPQISVFVINIQLKIFIGLIALLLFSPAISTFMNNYVSNSMDALQSAIEVLKN